MWVARSSPLRLLGLLILPLLFAAIGVLMIMDGDVIFGVVGLVAILGFGAVGLIVLGRLRRGRGIEIEVSGRGICWRAWSDDLIAWHEIRHAEVLRQGRQRYLCLWLDRQPEFRTRFAARGAALSRSIGYGDVALNTIGTDRTLDDLVDAVRRHIPVH